MAKTIAVLLYAAAAFGTLGSLVYREVRGKTPEARRARVKPLTLGLLQRRIKRHCLKMEKAKAKLSKRMT